MEETVSLVKNKGGAGALPPSGISRFKNLICIVLIGCFALFVWDNLEWDKSTGDVELKLYTGNKQKGENAISLIGADTITTTTDGQADKNTPIQGTDTTTTEADSNVEENITEEQQKDDEHVTEEQQKDDAHEPAAVVPATTEPPQLPAATTPVIPAATNPPLITSVPPQVDTVPPVIPAATQAAVPPLVATVTPIIPAATVPPVKPKVTAPPRVPVTPAGNASPECQQQCVTAQNNPARFEGEDLTLAANMQNRVRRYRQKWIDEFMKVEYGPYYDKIFEAQGQNIGRQRAFKSPNALKLPGHDATETDGPGWHRMIRKYQMKLLQVQLGMLDAKYSPVGYCSIQCAPPSEGHKMKPDHYARFNWINGGHSASAGHGNFYRESYTAQMGRDLQPILKEIGLDWVVKNYAMGGTDSAEEVALCHNSIFGKDVDSLSWDYGMTDGRDHNKMTLYAYRTARLSQLEDNFSQPGNIRHRPSLIAIHQNDDYSEVLQTMQNLGMTALGMDVHVKDDGDDSIVGGFPEMLGMNDAQIQALPPSVQYFKCEGKIEKGEPGCQANKYNETFCQNRKAKASWHPGVKYHALVGHLLAFTVLEVIDDALAEMIRLEPQTPETIQDKRARILQQLQSLDALEQADYDQIFNTPVPDNLLTYFDQNQWKGDNKDANKEAMKVMNLEWLIKHPVFCHTAMLPAEIRYRGLLTETNEVGTAIDEQFEKAIMRSQIVETEKPNPASGRTAQPFQFLNPAEVNYFARNQNSVMILAGKDNEREICPEAQTNVDVKDFFYISNVEGWKWVKVPNAAEQAYYTEFDATKSHGYIFMCMVTCDWGRCDEGDIRQNAMDFSVDPVHGGMTMEVNLVKVTSMNCLTKCCALKHDDPDPAQQFVWKPNAEGRYEFRAMISGGTDYGYARFSSFILL